MTPLTPEEQHAIDSVTEAPARVPVPGAGGVAVLLPAADFEWARGLVPDVPDVPRRIDPRDGQTYAVVPWAEYERFRAFFEEDPVTPEERRRLLIEFGKRAGWDDPELDVYEDYRQDA